MENEKLKNLQKQEAIKRLEILNKQYGILNNVVDDYKKQDLLYYSEQTSLGGILYWCTSWNGHEKFENIVKNFEKENNAIVYHAIHTYTPFGEILSLLYVSQYDEEWEQDIEDLKNGYPLAYCYNLDDELFSEYGTIGINGKMGGLVRVA